MNKKIDKTFLIFNPIVFIERELLNTRRKLKIVKFIFILLNLISLFALFFVASLTTITFSGVAWKINSWFYFTTTGITAAVTFLTSLVNFFFIKEKIDLYAIRIRFIYSTIIKYDWNKKTNKNNDNEFQAFHQVVLHLKYEKAKEYNERKI